MSLSAAEATPAADAMLAGALFAVDMTGTGGIALRALPGPDRDRWYVGLGAMLPPATPVRRLPVNVADNRLLGGLDLAATLRAGHPVAERGILAGVHGGILVVAMAERQPAATAARLAAAMDNGEVVLEREGLVMRSPSRFGVIALDEGIDGEAPSPALLDRLAFHLTLAGSEGSMAPVGREEVLAARVRLEEIAAGDAVIVALCAAAAALAVPGVRPVLLALAAARAHAALAGRSAVSDADAAVAARLVLAPRATVLPLPPPEADAAMDEPPPHRGEDPPPEEAGGDGTCQDAAGRGAEMVVAAAKAAIPPDLLAKLRLGNGRMRGPTAGRSGAAQKSARRGRPAGVICGERRDGARLNIIATLTAAAPWQPVRRRAAPAGGSRLIVRPQDFRITRFKQRTETTTIFVVDASGSSALNRLAEAKGAVELLLGECYVRRDRVAMVAMRGGSAEILLPPTRSLTRAKRNLASLPGGGGTALASGIDLAAGLASEVAKAGRTPILVVLTDGRPNMKRDGSAGRSEAEAEALAAARHIRAAWLTALLVDTSPRPHLFARSLAEAMGAHYLPLPNADAGTLSRAVAATSGNFPAAARP